MKLILLFTIVLSFGAFAKASTPKVEAEKIYTEDDFQVAIKKAISKYLMRIDKGNIVPFSNELIDREKKIKIREVNLEKREEAFSNTKKDFQKTIQEFKEQQNRFIGCVDGIEKERNTRIDHMVSTVSNMRPQQAADLLSVQESIIAVEILSKLDSAKVAKIFNLMKGEISARLQKQYMNMKR